MQLSHWRFIINLSISNKSPKTLKAMNERSCLQDFWYHHNLQSNVFSLPASDLFTKRILYFLYSFSFSCLFLYFLLDYRSFNIFIFIFLLSYLNFSFFFTFSGKVWNYSYNGMGLDLSRERGDNGLFITLVRKVLNNILLFVGLTTLGAFSEFLFVDSISFQPLVYRRGKFM